MSSFETLSLVCIASRLAEAGDVLILTHTNPDGDCIGSAAALAAIVRALGKCAYVATPDRLPPRLAFLLPEQESTAVTPEEAEKFETVISVDVASRSQLASLEYLAERVALMIDHHGVGEPFAPGFIDSGASAAGEIVWRLYRLMRERNMIPPLGAAARSCYAAVVSDTGSFKFSNVTPETHRAAAEMLEEMAADADGMSAEEICRSLFSKRTMTDLILQMTAIKNLRLHKDGKIGTVLLTAEEMREAGLESCDTGAAVEIPRSLDGVMIALSIKQSFTDPHLFKISSRSNCDADMAAVCARFGGGGHVKAAGCTLNAATPEEAEAVAVAAFETAL